jgi:hypothetical protein
MLGEPLSAPLINSLLDFSESAGMLRGLLFQYGYTELFYEMFFVMDLFFFNVVNGKNDSLETVIAGLASKDDKNSFRIQSKIMRKCAEFAAERYNKYGALLTTDLLRINESIRNLCLEPLYNQTFSDKIGSEAKWIGELLRRVYSNEMYPALIIAIMYLIFRLNAKYHYRVEIATQNILFGLMLNQRPEVPKIMLCMSKLKLVESVVLNDGINNSAETQIINSGGSTFRGGNAKNVL